MAMETVYTTGKSSTNARINIGSGAVATVDGQIAFPDECTSIKLVGAGSHADGTGVLLSIDNNGIIKKTAGTNITVALIEAAIASAGSSPATTNSLGTVYGNVGGDAGFGLSSPVVIGYGIAPAFQASTSTVIGYKCGAQGFPDMTSSSGDTVIGSQAMSSYVSGSNNVAIGFGAGQSSQSGTNNTFVGATAGVSALALSGVVALGRNAIAKASNEFAIAPTVTQWRSEGLSNISPAGYSKMMFDAVNKIIRPMSGCDVWCAQVNSDYTQSFAAAGNAFITGLVAQYGSTSSWLTSGSTITIPSGFPNLGLWEVASQVYSTNSTVITSLSLNIIRGGTTLVTHEGAYSTTSFNSRGGTRVVQLTPGQTIQMRMDWGATGSGSFTVKAVSTYIHLKFLGLGTL